MHIKEKRNKFPPCLKREKENNYDILSSFGWIGAKALLSISSMNFISLDFLSLFIIVSFFFFLSVVFFLLKKKTWWWRVNHFSFIYILYSMVVMMVVVWLVFCLSLFQVKILLLNDELFFLSSSFSGGCFRYFSYFYYIFFTYHSGNHNTFSFLYISSESTCMMLMPTGTTFHWP